MKETDMSGGTDPWYCSWPRGLGVMLGGRFASLFLPGPASFELFCLRLLPVSTRYMVKIWGLVERMTLIARVDSRWRG